MGMVHFITADIGLDWMERQEYVEELESSLRLSGRPHDKVILLCRCSHLASFPIEESLPEES